LPRCPLGQLIFCPKRRRFEPGSPGGTLGQHDAIKVDGDSGDTLNLTGGNWTAQAASNTPAGYTLYVHDTGGSNEDAYVLVQTVITVHTS